MKFKIDDVVFGVKDKSIIKTKIVGISESVGKYDGSPETTYTTTKHEGRYNQDNSWRADELYSSDEEARAKLEADIKKEIDQAYRNVRFIDLTQGRKP